MNDPGLDQPISEAGTNVEGTFGAFDGTDEEEERKYLDPRYAFLMFAARRFSPHV